MFSITSQRQDVAEFLQSLLTIETAAPEATGIPAVAEAMIGTKKTRLGCRPCQEHYEFLCSLISRHVRQNVPIELTTLWGGQKCYGICGHNYADLGDVLALRRFAMLQASVQSLYAPGLHIRVVAEDLTEYLLSAVGPLNIGCYIATYRQHLDDLRQAMGLDCVEFVCESALLARRNVLISDYFSRIAQNTALMLDYFKALERAEYQHPETLPEYKSLQVVGWNGLIPQEQWKHYIARTATEHPEVGHEEHVKAVCTYLGNALARYQYKLLQSTVTDEMGAVSPIKLSFVPYPPGTPHAMNRGRVEAKVKDSKSSNKTVAPWAGFGLYTHNDCTLIGINEWRAMATAYRWLVATINDVELPILSAA